MAQAWTTPVATHYRTAIVDGVRIFYREAGPADAPVVLLPHGFPTSSHMFRNLIPTLADRYRVIAPDYPGFGQSDMPDRRFFSYTFANYATLLLRLMEQLGVARYALYAFDYGAPVSFRMALQKPDRVTAFIVQNGNAYDEGLKEFWDTMKVYWASDTEANRAVLRFVVGPEAVKAQYTAGVADLSRLSPDTWLHDLSLLARPGNHDIQLDLFQDYGTNVTMYPQFQAYFRKHQPPMQILWGKHDVVFPPAGATPYLRDLPKAELRLLDTGHFALEDKLNEMVPLIRDFLTRTVG